MKNARKKVNITNRYLFYNMRTPLQKYKEISKITSYEYFTYKGAERWGRPHLSSLSFHSLINLRLALEKAVLILDFDHARDFTTIAFKVKKYAIFLILTYPCL